MITLTHLRALLECALTHAENPAIVRLTDRTVDGLARQYLLNGFWTSVSSDLLPPRYPHDAGYFRTVIGDGYEKVATMILSEPSTAHALLVALALALGLDPGSVALRVSWHHGTTSFGERYWCLSNNAETRTFFEWSQADGDFTAPSVAIEIDDAKALALAVLHVLEHP